MFLSRTVLKILMF